MPYPGYWSGDYYWSGGEYCRRHECRVLGHWRCRCVFLAVWEMPTTDSAADCGDGTYRTGASISTVLPYCFPEPEQIPGEAEAALTRLHKALWPRRKLERAMRFELTTPTLARLCSTPELRPLDNSWRQPGLPANRRGPVAGAQYTQTPLRCKRLVEQNGAAPAPRLARKPFRRLTNSERGRKGLRALCRSCIRCASRRHRRLLYGSPSSRGPGRRPLTAQTGVRIPVGTPDAFRNSGLLVTHGHECDRTPQ